MVGTLELPTTVSKRVSSLTAAACFLLFLGIALPLAAAVILVYVAFLIIRVAVPRIIMQWGIFEPAFAILMALFTFTMLSLEEAIAVWLLGYAGQSMYRGKTNWVLVASSVLIVFATASQILI